MFIKYPSIENHYQQRHVMKFLSEYPELNSEEFVLLEKLDGANVQFYFEPGKPYQVGKRSKFITPESDPNFFEIWDTLENYSEKFKEIQIHCEKQNTPFTIYGEIYGQGVQKRIDYGPNKRFSFFDVLIEKEFLSYNYFKAFTSSFDLLTPGLNDTVIGLENALQCTPPDKIEGYVIRPKNSEYISKIGKRCIFKHKTKAFAEKMLVKHKEYTPLPAEIQELRDNFVSYITDNRVDGVISKEGPIERPQQFSHYIKLVLNDAKEDFFKEYPDFPTDLTKSNEKSIFNVGQIIVEKLKERL